MKIIILAAGIGSRLRPLTYKKPKTMVKVNGVPIIEHQIQAYIKAGIEESDINIIIGYKAEYVSTYLKEKYPKVNMIVNKVYDVTNNMFSLDLGLQVINDNDLIISNGDCIYDAEIIKEFINNEDNSVASDKGAYNEESMKIIVKDDKIIQISKQINQDDAYGNSIDLYKINKDDVLKLKKITKKIIKKDKNLWSEVAINELFSDVRFTPFDISGKKWMEIDNYDDLYIAENKFSQFSLKSKKALVLDLDGTVYLGNTPINGTVDFIKKNSEKYDIYFMTNNTSNNLNSYVLKLENYGIKTSIDKILSPLLPLITYIKDNSIKNIFIVGNELFKEYLKEKCDVFFTNEQDKCEAVIVAYDTELTYEKLKEASLLLHNKNIKLIATHEDVVCPTEFGDIPDIGAILKLLELTTKRTPDIVLGKPNKILLEPIINKYSKNEIAVCGDRLYTDKLMANTADIDFILVLSGETKREDVEYIDTPPEIIVKNLGVFNE